MSLRSLVIGLSAGIALTGHSVQAQPICLPIDRVQIDGAKVVPEAALQQAVAAYGGKCLGLAEFDQIIEAITTVYLDRGYVLSRAYLPEQDLTTRALRIAVIEGEISDIRINGAADPGLEQAAFPGQRGRPGQIRAVEQGLDQIQAMPRWQASMEFTPGQEAGQSVLDVSAQTAKPWQFKLSSNNRGNKQSGAWITTASLDWTNLLGRADRWSLSHTRSLSPGPLSFGYDGDSSSSTAFRFHIPQGRWTYDVSAGNSRNSLTIPGAIAPIATNGSSWNASFGAKRLLHRDRTSKTHARLSLSHSVSRNYIQGVLIQASSRKLTALRLSVDHERPLLGGTLSGSVYLDKGLTWFGAERVGDRPAGSPNAQHSLLGVNADWQRSFEGELAKTDISVTFAGQLSHDKLYGGQQFSLGGPATVRGSKIALASGSSGVLLRNEAVIKPAAFTGTGLEGLGIYGALDLGQIAAQPGIGVKPAYAAGGTIGLKGQIGKFDFDLSYQRILAHSARLSGPRGDVFLSVGVVF